MSKKVDNIKEKIKNKNTAKDKTTKICETNKINKIGKKENKKKIK